MNDRVKRLWNLETEAMSRFTFWVVLSQAILVIALLGVTVRNVTTQASRAEIQSIINEQLIKDNLRLLQDNTDLIIEFRESQTSLRIAMMESIFCMLKADHDNRNDSDAQVCLDVFLNSEAVAETGYSP